MGDFNIHIDVENNSLNTVINSLLDSIGFSQDVNEPTHHFFPQNHLLSEHFLITFNFKIIDYIAVGKKMLF